jgi:hypothetical protein
MNFQQYFLHNNSHVIKGLRHYPALSSEHSPTQIFELFIMVPRMIGAKNGL